MKGGNIWKVCLVQNQYFTGKRPTEVQNRLLVTMQVTMKKRDKSLMGFHIPHYSWPSRNYHLLAFV